MMRAVHCSTAFAQCIVEAVTVNGCQTDCVRQPGGVLPSAVVPAWLTMSGAGALPLLHHTSLAVTTTQCMGAAI